MKLTDFLAGRFSLMLAALMCLASAARSYAAIPTTDVGQMQLGVEYNVGIDNKGETLVGTFTAPGSGVLTFDFGFTTKSYFNLYSDDTYKTVVPTVSRSNYPNINRYNVEQGVTYYVKVANPAYNSSTFTMSLPGYGKVMGKIDTLDPTPDYYGETRVFDLAQYKGLEIRCTQSVSTYPDSISGDYLKVALGFTDRLTGGRQSVLLRYFRLSATIVYCHTLGDELMGFLRGGNIEPGDQFTITISNLKDRDGDYFEGFEDGASQSFEYICGSLPTSVVSEVWPEQFLSYWPKGTEAGIAKITFSGPLSTEIKPTCRITAGNSEGDAGVDFYASTLPVAVDGNTITVDFTGVRRAFSELLTVKDGEKVGMTIVDLSCMGVQINNICDIYGNMVESPTQGNVGSIGRAIPYVELEKAGVAADFTPAPGSDLSNVNEMEVWITGLKNFTFSGFDITADGGLSINVPEADVTVTDEEADGAEAVFTFTLPEAAKTAKNVRVTVANFVTLDGHDYTADLSAIFNCLTLQSLSPADGTAFAGIAANEEIAATFNFAATYPAMCVMYQIADMNPATADNAVIKAWSLMTRQPDGSYTAAPGFNLPFYKEHSYRVTFEAWETETDMNQGYASLGTVTATWNGDKEPVVASDVALVAVTPAAGTILANRQANFKVSFSEPVAIDTELSVFTAGSAEAVPFSSVKASGDNTEEIDGVQYSSEWTLVIASSYMTTVDTEVSVTIVATDRSGRRVTGNTGEGEESYFFFSYPTERQYRPATEPAEGASCTDLKSITLVFDAVAMVTPGTGVATMTITPKTAARAAAQTVELPAAQPGSAPNELVQPLGAVYTDEGTYTVNMPAGYVLFGEDMVPSLAMTYRYAIDGTTGVLTIGSDACGMWTVHTLQGVKVLSTDNYDAIRALPAGIYVVNGVKVGIR